MGRFAASVERRPWARNRATSWVQFSLQARVDRPLIRMAQLPQMVFRQFLRKAIVPSCSP